MRHSRTDYAVLGLLALGPRTGYAIRKDVTEVLGHFWRESFGQIYPALRRLARRRLVVRRAGRTSRPAGRTRIEYRITPAGRAALRRWLAMPVRPSPPRHELLLKLFFARFARPGDVGRVVAGYRAEAERAAARLGGVARVLADTHADDPSFPHWSLTLRFGLGALEAILAWCAEAERTLAREAPR
jgi:DNA-binding PadR family transcriptional regulator